MPFNESPGAPTIDWLGVKVIITRLHVGRHLVYDFACPQRYLYSPWPLSSFPKAKQFESLVKTEQDRLNNPSLQKKRKKRKRKCHVTMETHEENIRRRWRQRSGWCPKPENAASRRELGEAGPSSPSQPQEEPAPGCLDFELLASRTAGVHYCFKSPSWWYFITAAPANPSSGQERGWHISKEDRCCSGLSRMTQRAC